MRVDARTFVLDLNGLALFTNNGGGLGSFVELVQYEADGSAASERPGINRQAVATAELLAAHDRSFNALGRQQSLRPSLVAEGADAWDEILSQLARDRNNGTQGVEPLNAVFGAL